MAARAEMTKAWVGSTDLSETEQMRLALWLTGLEESLAWHERIVLDCLDVRRQKDGWRIRLQGRRHNDAGLGKSVVCWSDGRTFYDAMARLAQAVSRKDLQWRVDKYPVFD